jgi:hypothetical protein
MSNPIYVSTEELPVSFGDPHPQGYSDRRVLVIKDDLAAELETLAKSLNHFTLRDALRWLGERNAEYRIKPDAPTTPPTSEPAEIHPESQIKKFQFRKNDPCIKLGICYSTQN